MTRKRKSVPPSPRILKENRLDESIAVNNTIKECLKKHKNIEKLYDWQVKCLKIPGIGREKNLVYSLPTSGGKTLISEILMFKQLTQLGKSVIFVLPFVSIVQEKVKSFEPFGLDLNFLVEEYAGSKGQFPPTKHRKPSLFVATIEKGHILINSIIENNQIDRIGLLVVDEIHMIGDGSRRGANLELMVVKFMKMFKNAKVIGMSATLDNMDELSQFLNAESFVSDFRPIILKEYVKLNKDICFVNRNNNYLENEIFNFTRKCDFRCDKFTQRRDPDNITGLLMEILPDKSCLIFCPTKRQCETLTENLSNLMRQDVLNMDKKLERREELIKLIKNECSNICPLLNRSLKLGIAYHHSGLTQEERKIIEEGFVEGTISVICCTSTLAAGVNLPARRVIIRSPYVGRDFISYNHYKQMTGRAGRAGFDTEGESFVVLDEKDKNRFIQLVTESNSVCRSSLLTEDANLLKHFLLSVLHLNVCGNCEDIIELLTSTLFNIQNPGLINELVKEKLQELINEGFIKQLLGEDSKGAYFKITEIGKAIVKGGIEVSRAQYIYDDLKKAEVSLNISTYLHLLYIVTPFEYITTISPNWNVYLNSYKKLPENDKLLANYFGIDENFLMRRTLLHRCKTDFNASRFYITLMLYDLWLENSTFWVAEKYAFSRGQVQNLLQAAVIYSACLTNFVEEFSSEFWAYKDLLPNFTKRLSHCVRPEILPLMQINGIKRGRANKLYQAGYDNISKIAAADPKKMLDVLFPINKKNVDQIIMGAKMIIQERIDSLNEEVKDLISSSEDNNENINVSVVNDSFDILNVEYQSDDDLFAD